MAVSTRRRLHGLKWPSTNPKLLAVDFLSPDQVQKISEGDLVVMEAPPEAEAKEEKEAGVRDGEGEKEEEVVSVGGEGVKRKAEEEEEEKMEVVERDVGEKGVGERKRRRASEEEKQGKVQKTEEKESIKKGILS